MHDDRSLVEARLERALRQFLRPAQYGDRVPLTLSAWHAPGEPVPVGQALQASYEPFTTGMAWGKPWSTSWFRIEGRVPEDWAGRLVEVVIDPGFTGDGPGFQAEGLLYDTAACPSQGHPPAQPPPDGRGTGEGRRGGAPAAGGGGEPRRPARFRAHPLGDVLTAGDGPIYRFAAADLAVLDEDVWHLVLDTEVLSELMYELDPQRPRRHEILRALENMLDALDLHDVSGTAAAARAELTEVLSRPASASAHRVSATGHAHIDSAWLWPLRETVRKASRTFANVTALALDYPELVFSCSQAQQYAWVKEHQPHIWERIKKAVREGNWAPVGSMWVESDANMPGGEALARQIVHGKRFFREELGVETEEIWLPDSFGYTAAFPQLAKLMRRPLVPHPEAELEPDQQDAPSHLLVGGHRRHPGLHPLPARGHLQLAVPRQRTRPRGTQLRGEGPGDPLTRPVRLGRRRGRPDPRNAGEGTPVAVPGGLAHGPDRETGGVLRRRRGRVRGPRAGVVGRAVPGTAPGHLHHAGQDQAGQPPLRTRPA